MCDLYVSYNTIERMKLLDINRKCERSYPVIQTCYLKLNDQMEATAPEMAVSNIQCKMIYTLPSESYLFKLAFICLLINIYVIYIYSLV